MPNDKLVQITEYRADGWPLCPHCGEDELWSQLHWDGLTDRPPLAAWLAAGLRCYRCNWHGSIGSNEQEQPNADAT
jgi:hypothetical protein